ASIGISVSLWHYLLMGAVSITTVAAFDSVGAILVVALFVVPPATAYLLTDKLKPMLLLTAVLSVVVSVLGYYLAVLLDGSIAGAIVTVAGMIFALVFVFSPQTRVFTSKKSIQISSDEKI
ncbi:MAG: metal ABC transporter permease, partial [Bacteroidota bacterium]